MELRMLLLRCSSVISEVSFSIDNISHSSHFLVEQKIDVHLNVKELCIPDTTMIPRLWAQQKVDTLSITADHYSKELLEIGRKFGKLNSQYFCDY